MGQNGVLYGLDPATGQVRQQATVGAPANHFPTPCRGRRPPAGHQLRSGGRVRRSGPGPQAGVTAPASPAPSAATSRGILFPAIGIIALVALAVIVGVAVLTRRRLSGRD